MVKTAESGRVDVVAALLEAARGCLVSDGFSALSTRKIAAEAGVPLSQVHYHFGSKQGLMLALLQDENRRRLERQTTMYANGEPLWRRYEQACDFLEDDLTSGFVRVLQEMIAAGWSNPEIAAAAREILSGWYALLTDVAREAGEALGGLGPFTAAEVATLIGAAFLGAESMLLVGFQRQELPVRSSLRRFADVLRTMEERSPQGHRQRRAKR